MNMVPDELVPYLELNAKRLRNLGLAAAIGFGILAVCALGAMVHAMVADVPAHVMFGCRDAAACIARHRNDGLTSGLIFAVFTGLPALIGIVVFAQNRSPHATKLAKAIASGGAGLRAVYPVKTTLTAAGFRVGDSWEIVFERVKGEPWKWLVRGEQVDGVMRALRRAVPNVLTEPPPI